MGDSEGRSACIIHFDGKFGPQKRLSNETLKTICLRREEWLALPDNECHDNQKNIANQSFEFIPDHVKDIQELQEPAFYHMSCYRSFTDVTKLQRAKNSTEKIFLQVLLKILNQKTKIRRIVALKKRYEGQEDREIKMAQTMLTFLLESHRMFFRNVA